MGQTAPGTGSLESETLTGIPSGCWDVSSVSRHQTLSPVISQSCAPSIIRSPGASPLLSLNKDPEALSTWALGSVQCLRHREGPSNIPSIIPSHCSSVIIIRVGDRSTQNIAETNKQNP